MVEASNDTNPVRCTVRVRPAPREAFRIFTEEINTWWPLASHSVCGDRARRCVFEGRIGGSVHEIADEGTVQLWGTVTTWEPPERVVFSWHPGRAASTAQEVELRFVPDGSGTRVELEHRRWDRFGDGSVAARDRYEQGWPPVLDRFVGRAGPPA
jgi:uncharacterized protein YndB with AHSA1/START domain